MPGSLGRLGVSVLMRFLRPFVDARSEIGGFEMCLRSWGPGRWWLGCWRANGLPAMRGPHGPHSRRQAKIAGRFAAGHGGLAAQVGINCITIRQFLSKSGNHTCPAMPACRLGTQAEQLLPVIPVLCSEPDVFGDAKESTLKGQSEVSDRYLSEHRAEAAGLCGPGGELQRSASTCHQYLLACRQFKSQ